LVDEYGEILDTARAMTPNGQNALEDAICSAVGELLTKHTVTAVGLAVAGFVASDHNTVMFAPHLSWRNVPVADRISDKLGLPVVLEHDCNAAAVAEHRFGAAKGASVAVLVALGTGIGGALLVNGELFRGGHGVAPELGHLRLVPNGRACPCGKNGCWERYCSGTALATTAGELLAANPSMSTVLSRESRDDLRELTGRKVAAAARDGDPLAQKAMSDLATWLGEGLALVADVYDPEVIVIGGGVSASATLFLDDARDHFNAVMTGAGHRPKARIRTAQLGDDAGMVGAAIVARSTRS
jgi:glucokinase